MPMFPGVAAGAKHRNRAMSSKKASTLPPDQDQRDLIVRELDRTMLVEAAAGTGKTTAMIGRMVALLLR